VISISSIEKEKWVKWYREMPVYEIAAALRVCSATIHKHLSRHGVITPGTARRERKPMLYKKKIK
jgi:hypothetical protein